MKILHTFTLIFAHLISHSVARAEDMNISVEVSPSTWKVSKVDVLPVKISAKLSNASTTTKFVSVYLPLEISCIGENKTFTSKMLCDMPNPMSEANLIKIAPGESVTHTYDAELRRLKDRFRLSGAIRESGWTWHLDIPSGKYRTMFTLRSENQTDVVNRLDKTVKIWNGILKSNFMAINVIK